MRVSTLPVVNQTHRTFGLAAGASATAGASRGGAGIAPIGSSVPSGVRLNPSGTWSAPVSRGA